MAAVTSGGQGGVMQGGVMRHREDGRLPFTCEGIETRDPE